MRLQLGQWRRARISSWLNLSKTNLRAIFTFSGREFSLKPQGNILYPPFYCNINMQPGDHLQYFYREKKRCQALVRMKNNRAYDGTALEWVHSLLWDSSKT